MSAYYQRISPISSPFDMGTDGKGRAMRGFNVTIIKRPSEDLEAELLQVLVDASLGAIGTVLFSSQKQVVPDVDTAILLVISTGGTAPLNTHNSAPTPAYERPTAKIVCRARKTSDVKALAYSAWLALSAVRNATITVA